MTSLLMSSPPISISHRLFGCRYSNSRDMVASSLSFSHPATRAPWRACWQARLRAAKIANISWLLSLRVCMLWKSAIRDTSVLQFQCALMNRGRESTCSLTFNDIFQYFNVVVFRLQLDIRDRHETEVINIKNCHGGLGEFVCLLPKGL